MEDVLSGIKAIVRAGGVVLMWTGVLQKANGTPECTGFEWYAESKFYVDRYRQDLMVGVKAGPGSAVSTQYLSLLLVDPVRVTCVKVRSLKALIWDKL